MTDIAAIDAAALRLSGRARVTPVLSSPFIDEIAGRRVFVKAECLQHTGSFKFRGAWSAISALSPSVRANGVIAFSSGNHAQGVAHAAKLHGVDSVIIMPKDAPQLKIANTRALGAEVVLYDRAGESREEIGQRISSERGMTLIRPYDEPLVIAGQGTAGLELAEQLADLGMRRGDVLVPAGGGGLTAGIALALEARAPDLQVRPCEPEGYDDTARSLAAGSRQRNASMQNGLCDAIVTPEPGEITFPIVQRLCGSGLVVSDDEVLQAVALAWLRLKIVVEPGGAVGLAAALFHGDKIKGEDVAVVCSGGNIDREVFDRALATLKV